jgi:hypothetical protein
MMDRAQIADKWGADTPFSVSVLVLGAELHLAQEGRRKYEKTELMNGRERERELMAGGGTRDCKEHALNRAPRNPGDTVQCSRFLRNVALFFRPIRKIPWPGPASEL